MELFGNAVTIGIQPSEVWNMSMYELAWCFHQYAQAHSSEDGKSATMSDAEFSELSKFIDETPVIRT